MTTPIPVNTPEFNGNEAKYLEECISTGWVSSEGPFIKKFEANFAKLTERKYGIAVSNGTAALDVAVKALDIGKGDEVILPSFTIISCVQSILNSDATPVLVDSNPDTWGLDVTQLEAKITPNTKAIMMVHIYGITVDIDPVLKLARKYNLKIIEDAAEAHGQNYYGKPCGSFGDISTFSFYPNKHITTGEGGMVVCNSKTIMERCKSLRNLCFRPEERFVHYELGWNYRMTNLQAAMGVAQIENIASVVKKKRKIGLYYLDKLQQLPHITLPIKNTKYCENIFWVFSILIKKDAPFTRSEFMSYLSSQKIGTRPFFWGMHEQPVLIAKNLFHQERYPVCEYISRQGFYLPSGLGLQITEQKRVIETVKTFLSRY